MLNFTVKHVFKPTRDDLTGKVTECQWKDADGNDHAANFPGHYEKNLIKNMIEERIKKNPQN